MTTQKFRQFAQSRASGLAEHYDAAQASYQSIWKKYDRQMPRCIDTCTKLRDIHAEGAWLDGPQGIYWVGATPKVLFAGREHFGWYGPGNMAEGRSHVCYFPLEFAYFAVPYKGTYWAIIKELIEGALDFSLEDWDEVLRHVAFTNACKCLTDSASLQWSLHQECMKQAYLLHEIRTVGAPLNILFTRRYDVARQLFSGKADVLEDGDDFLVLQSDGQTIVECAHPGRQSRSWREELKGRMKQHLDVVTQALP